MSHSHQQVTPTASKKQISLYQQMTHPTTSINNSHCINKQTSLTTSTNDSHCIKKQISLYQQMTHPTTSTNNSHCINKWLSVHQQTHINLWFLHHWCCMHLWDLVSMVFCKVEDSYSCMLCEVYIYDKEHMSELQITNLNHIHFTSFSSYSIRGINWTCTWPASGDCTGIAPVLRKSWVRIPLEPHNFFWALFVTA